MNKVSFEAMEAILEEICLDLGINFMAAGTGDDPWSKPTNFDGYIYNANKTVTVIIRDGILSAYTNGSSLGSVPRLFSESLGDPKVFEKAKAYVKGVFQ